MLQNATPLRKSAPGPPNSSDEHVSCTAPATENTSLQILFKCPTPAIVFWKCHKTLAFCSLLAGCRIPCACQAKPHLNFQLPKVVRTWCALYILTWKCASRHNGVHFFDISTSKSGLRMVFFTHFDLEMCFAPQQRATFHLLSGHMSPTFRPSGATSHWETQCFATLLPSSLTLPTSAFPCIHIFGSLTKNNIRKNQKH